MIRCSKYTGISRHISASVFISLRIRFTMNKHVCADYIIMIRYLHTSEPFGHITAAQHSPVHLPYQLSALEPLATFWLNFYLRFELSFGDFFLFLFMLRDFIVAQRISRQMPSNFIRVRYVAHKRK